MDLMTTFGWVAAGTGFTFLMTALGAASVFFFRKKISENIHRMALGLAAGIMIAASVWSLLIPAMEAAEEAGGSGWLPAAGGFILGVAFLLFLDEILPHLHPGSKDPEGPKSELSRASLLFLAVTLHNIPEGMSVGGFFAFASGRLQRPKGLCFWRSVRFSRTRFRSFGCALRGLDYALYALASRIQRRRHDVCGGRRVNSSGAFG